MFRGKLPTVECRPLYSVMVPSVQTIEKTDLGEAKRGSESFVSKKSRITPLPILLSFKKELGYHFERSTLRETLCLINYLCWEKVSSFLTVRVKSVDSFDVNFIKRGPTHGTDTFLKLRGRDIRESYRTTERSLINRKYAQHRLSLKELLRCHGDRGRYVNDYENSVWHSLGDFFYFFFIKWPTGRESVCEDL